VEEEGVSKEFVIRVTDTQGRESWVTPADPDGIRSLSVRSDAALFSTREEAQLAINTMPLLLTDLGTVFVIEPAV
jgi:hypothetical protein